MGMYLTIGGERVRFGRYRFLYFTKDKMRITVMIVIDVIEKIREIMVSLEFSLMVFNASRGVKFFCLKNAEYAFVILIESMGWKLRSVRFVL